MSTPRRSASNPQKPTLWASWAKESKQLRRDWEEMDVPSFPYTALPFPMHSLTLWIPTLNATPPTHPPLHTHKHRPTQPPPPPTPLSPNKCNFLSTFSPHKLVEELSSPKVDPVACIGRRDISKYDGGHIFQPVFFPSRIFHRQWLEFPKIRKRVSNCFLRKIECSSPRSLWENVWERDFENKLIYKLVVVIMEERRQSSGKVVAFPFSIISLSLRCRGLSTQRVFFPCWVRINQGDLQDWARPTLIFIHSHPRKFPSSSAQCNQRKFDSWWKSTSWNWIRHPP